MSRHTVTYHRCVKCGFVQTEEPYWLSDAYEHPVHAADTGHVARNLALADMTQSVIAASHIDPRGRFLDYGGGTGLLVRLMRDRGFDFYLHDPYAPNLFAQGFALAVDDGQRLELATAYEVAEHLPDPIAGFHEMLGRADSVLFSTVLLPDPPPRPGKWWYYSLETGQHVSLYTHDALQVLADRFGLSVRTSANGARHLLTRDRLALRLFRIASRDRVARLARWRTRAAV